MTDKTMQEVVERALRGARTAYEHDPKAAYRTIPAALCDAAADMLAQQAVGDADALIRALNQPTP